jgi:hypothetical protein
MTKDGYDSDLDELENAGKLLCGDEVAVAPTFFISTVPKS